MARHALSYSVLYTLTLPPPLPSVGLCALGPLLLNSTNQLVYSNEVGIVRLILTLCVERLGIHM